MAIYNYDKTTYSNLNNVPGFSYSRSGTAYQQNASGVWTSFDENVPPISDGVTQADFGTRVVSAGAQTKVAVRFKTDSIAMSVNGQAVETDLSATLVSQYSKLYYGTTGASGYFNGDIQRCQVINGNISDSELQTLTI